AGEGEAAEIGEALRHGAGGLGIGAGGAADGGEGIVEEVGVELVAEDLEAGLLLGEAGGEFLVALDAVETSELGVAGAEFLGAGGDDGLEFFRPTQQCARAPAHDPYDAESADHCVATEGPS